MITTLMNQKRGLNKFSKLPDDGDPCAPNNLLKPGAKVETRWAKHQTRNSGLNQLKMNSFMSGPL